ncbi:unannotated protein [freshwater metagenome]|uniref:Unannotated protein n=1 Tax=freshwater metagenome TaxID=449393 RepID=A0A6J7L6J1_9ZZZZ
MTNDSVVLNVNSSGPIEIDGLAPDARLLDVLRDRLGLLGTKESCGRGECGACTVLIDGRAVLSCITLAARVSGHVETIEGVSAESERLRSAFANQGALQCGFCTPGQIVRGTALLREGLPDDDADLRSAMSGNICRCTGYVGIIAALREAAS